MRELWVFNYNPGAAFNLPAGSGKPLDEKDSDFTHKQQQQPIISNGTWNARSRSAPMQVTKMFYLALHNLIEKVMHQNSFLRIGECFVKRIKGDQRKNSIEAGLLGCSFTFFLTGDTLCFHVRVERIKLRNLLHSDLSTKEKVTVLTSPNSLVGTLIGGRFLDDSASPASSGVLKEWSNFFHLRPPLKSEESYSHNDKFLSSTAIVKVAFGNKQGFEMDFPAECVFRLTGDTRKDPTQILHVMYRRSLGLEVPKLNNVSYPDATGFALFADYQWAEDDHDPSRHMQVDFWTYTSPFQYHTIQTVHHQRQQYLLQQQQQQQQQLLLQKQQKAQDLRSPVTNIKTYTPQQTPSTSPLATPSPMQQDGDQSSPALPDKDAGAQYENTESEASATSSSQLEGKKKRTPQQKRKQQEPATGRPPKKPKKTQSPVDTPPPPAPAPEKKKQAAKKQKKPPPTTTATKKGKKGKTNTETSNTPQLSQSDSIDTSNVVSSSLPMMMPSTVTNSTHVVGMIGNEFDVQFSKPDDDMELSGDIDISMWLNSASNVAPATSAQSNSLSPSAVDLDKELDFFSSPVTTPATQKPIAVVPMSPTAFPIVDDAVEIHFTGNKSYLTNQSQYTPNSTNPTPSPTSSSPISPSPLSSPNITHSTNSLSNSQADSGSITAPQTPQTTTIPPITFLSASHDSYLPLANQLQNKIDKKPRRFHTFLCAKSYQPLGEGDLPAVSPRHLYTYTPQSKGPPLVDAISYTPEPFPVVPSTSTPSTPSSAISTPLSNLTPALAFTATPFLNKTLDRKSGARLSTSEEDASDSESEESSDEDRDYRKDSLPELALAINSKHKTEEPSTRMVPDSLQYLQDTQMARKLNLTRQDI